MKYLDKEIDVKIASENDIGLLISFQKEVINKMDNKDFFTPLTKKEFLEPIKGKDNVYMLFLDKSLIAILVATCDIPNLLEEYKLSSNNVLLINIIMVKDDYRGHGLQRQMLEFIYDKAIKLNKDGLVATVHPENIHIIANFLKEEYEIINKLNIHGGPRYIFYKKTKDKQNEEVK